MRIELKYGYFIEVDPMCYTLKKKYMGKNKQKEPIECESVHGYFGTLRQAIEKFIFLNHIDQNADLSVKFFEYVNLVEESNKNAVRDIASVLEGNKG